MTLSKITFQRSALSSIPCWYVAVELYKVPVMGLLIGRRCPWRLGERPSRRCRRSAGHCAKECTGFCSRECGSQRRGDRRVVKHLPARDECGWLVADAANSGTSRSSHYRKGQLVTGTDVSVKLARNRCQLVSNAIYCILFAVTFVLGRTRLC